MTTNMILCVILWSKNVKSKDFQFNFLKVTFPYTVSRMGMPSHDIHMTVYVSHLGGMSHRNIFGKNVSLFLDWMEAGWVSHCYLKQRHVQLPWLLPEVIAHPSKKSESGVRITSMDTGVWNQALRHAVCFYKHCERMGLSQVFSDYSVE